MAKKVANVYLADVLQPFTEEAPKAILVSSDEEKEFSIANLSQYAGIYYSEELDVVYKLSEEKGSLLLSVKDNNPLKLTSTELDTFFYEYIALVFDREDNNAISGFKVNAGRVQNLAFEKIK
ncbi:MAG: hypothetical protein DRI71_04965 [Bacteroidetes bacterium]|nr:MAG: hypothetical protein DRI71_04965 [Bacteroidota bacterium]